MVEEKATLKQREAAATDAESSKNGTRRSIPAQAAESASLVAGPNARCVCREEDLRRAAVARCRLPAKSQGRGFPREPGQSSPIGEKSYGACAALLWVYVDAADEENVLHPS